MSKTVLGEEEEPCACIVWGRGEKFQVARTCRLDLMILKSPS